MKGRNSYLQIVLAACLWGGIGVFVKGLSALGLTSLQTVAVRNLAAAAAIFLVLLVRRPAELSIRLCHLRYFVGSGVCGLLFFNWCYFNTISLSSMSVAAVFLYTSPAFVMLLSALLFGEKVTSRKLLALAITFAGCVLATGLFPLQAVSLSPRVVLLGLGAGFGYSLYSIFSKAALRHCPSSTVTFYTILLCAVCSFPLSGLAGRADVLTQPAFWGNALGIGILCCALPGFLYTNGLQGAEPGRAAILATAELLVASVLGVFLYADEITAWKLAGMAAILGAIALLNWPAVSGKTPKIS